jgi:type IV secretory pathway VirB4 component
MLNLLKKKAEGEVEHTKVIKKNRNDKAEKEKIDEKIDATDISDTIFEKNRKKLKDLIAPDSLDFTISPRYATLGDKYFIKGLYVGLLPNSVNFASFLHGLYNFGNIDTSIYINPVDVETAKADLSKIRTNLEMEYLTAQGSNRADDMANKMQEAKMLRSEIRDGLNKLYEVSIISTLYEESERALNNRTDQLKEILGQSDIGLKSAVYVQELAYNSNKPIMENTLGEWHTFDKRSLACVFPFTSNNINHPKGVPLGFNMDNSLPVIYDTFFSGLDNYNMVIFAKSGGGKSTFIKMLSARSSTLDTIQNIFIDIEPEYNNICQTLGGQIIKIAPDTTTIINPFDITLDEVENEITGRKEDKILLSDKVNSVSAIIMTMAKGQIPNNPYYNDITRVLIKDAVKAEYNRIGITERAESLYEYEEERIVDGKIVGGKTKKEMPTLSTFYAQVQKMASNNTNETYKPYYDYLLKVLSDFCRLTRGSFTCFDGQSTVRLGYDIPFINFDVSGLNEKTELPIAQHLITDYIWEHMIKRNSGGHKIRVGIDEAWRMIKYPDALEFLITGFRRARKKNTSFVVISQQFDEFFNENTKPIIKNSDTKLFLPPDETSVDSIKEIFKLTEGQAEFLRVCKRGEGLLIVNNTSVKLNIEIPDFEIDFVETNQNALRERKMAGVDFQ